MVERCPDKTEVVGPIPTTRTLGGMFSFTVNSLAFVRQRSYGPNSSFSRRFSKIATGLTYWVPLAPKISIVWYCIFYI